MTNITVTDVTSPSVNPVIVISDCPSSGPLICRQITVFTDKARPIGELNYTVKVTTLGTERTFTGKIQIDCSAQVQIISPSSLSSVPRLFIHNDGP